METETILQCGLFDSKKFFYDTKESPIRTVQHFEFDYILSCDKNAVSNIDGKSAKLRPNMLIVRKPNQKSNSILHFKCYCLHLFFKRDDSVYKDLMSAPEYFTLINAENYQNIFKAIFRHLLRYPKKTTDYFLYSKICELLYFVKKDENRNRKVSAISMQKENDCVQKAIEFIKQNRDKNISLQRLGSITGYSPNHFQKIFKELMDITPQKYLEKLRIEQAEYMLIERDKSISEIAYACGFSSQSYFSKIFKKYTLLTPLEYQKKSAFKGYAFEN